MNYTANLCGYFSMNRSRINLKVLDKEWERINVSKEKIKQYSNYYYPEFVNFNFGNNARYSMLRYHKTIEQEIVIRRNTLETEKQYNLTVRDITIYIAPHNILMYSICIYKEYDDLDDVTAIASILRNIIGYEHADVQSFIECAMMPLMTIYNAFTKHPQTDNDYSLLIENGNKLKIFQTVEMPIDKWVATNIDITLFEIGTVAPIGSYKADALNSSSSHYFEDIIKQNSLSIYNNWKCLSLFDTYTIVYCDCPEWLLNNWQNDYFGMIYISLLYKRFYLFRTNLLFRFKLKNVEKLSKEFLTFERHHCFFNVSYNFLPQEINQSIAIGLEIENEKKELYHMIEQENTQREKNDDGRMNKLLFFLTCITIISVIWDASCLANELYPFSSYWETKVMGYQVVTYSIILIVLVAIIINRLFKKRS